VLETKTGAGSWATVFSGPLTAPAAIQSLAWGAFGCTKASDIRYSQFAISDTGFAELDKDFYHYASGTRDLTQTQMAMGAWVPAGMFRDQAKVRLRYALGGDPAIGGASTTAPVLISAAQQNIAAIQITGLIPNMLYSYQIEVLDSADNLLHASRTYRFHTLATAGTQTAAQWNYTSCYTQQAFAHPYREAQYTLSRITDDYRGTIFLGDLGYEADLRSYIANRPTETRDDFERKIRDCFTDIDMMALQEAGLFLAQPDDHETINEMDSRIKGSSQLANNFFGEQSGDKYTATRTTGELWTNGLGVWQDWFVRMRLDRPADDFGEMALYLHRVDGETEIVLIDTRYTRNDSQNRMVSAQQLAWIKDRADNLLPTTKTVMIPAQTGFSDWSRKNSDTWFRNAGAQYREFLDYLIANIPEARVLLLAGDDHMGFGLNRNMPTTVNPVLPANFLGELYASPGSMSHHWYLPPSNSNARGLSGPWVFDDTVLSHGPSHIKFSGVMVDVAQDSSIALGVFYDGTEDTHTPYVAPAPDVTSPTITSAASFSLAENTQLAHALTADEAVAWTIVGGADDTQFEISDSTLRWAGNGTKDFEQPGESNANNIYLVTVRATDGAGNFTDQQITATVTDVAEGGPVGEQTATLRVDNTHQPLVLQLWHAE
jgi:hypothetical protein